MTAVPAPFHGTLQILRYNWSAYVIGLAALSVAVLALFLLPLPRFVLMFAWFGVGFAIWWMVVSILASYWIYDASPLSRWEWLASHVGEGKRQWVNLHAGLDESTPDLILYFGPPLHVLDFFDLHEMTEKSILRARACAKNAVTAERARYDSLPVHDAEADLACVIFSAHELRSKPARSKFFAELARICRPGGQVVIVEHLRDLPNFLAFGPGFMHFFSRVEWLSLARNAGMRLRSQRSMTPFVRLFLFERA